jgi:hypothetical protein
MKEFCDQNLRIQNDDNIDKYLKHNQSECSKSEKEA